jgi:nitrite reductase/ring-hydroxylating ferredoxin subunit
MSQPNRARPADGTALIALDKLKPRSAVVVDFREGDAHYSLIVARDEHGVYAYENSCPHARAPLERFDGVVIVQQKRFILCAMHGASFGLADGKCVGGPALGTALTPETVHVEAGMVRLGLGAAPA